MRKFISLGIVLVLSLFLVSNIFAQQSEMEEKKDGSIDFDSTISKLENDVLKANEATAKINVEAIIVAINSYKSSVGSFPKKEKDLVPYMRGSFNNQVDQGYKYSLTFSGGGYKIIATPVQPGKTGNCEFTVENDGKIIENIIE